MRTLPGVIVHEYNSDLAPHAVSGSQSNRYHQLVKPDIIVVQAPDGRILMRIDPDGNYHGELADASEAARIFCEAVQEIMRRS